MLGKLAFVRVNVKFPIMIITYWSKLLTAKRKAPLAPLCMLLIEKKPVFLEKREG